MLTGALLILFLTLYLINTRPQNLSEAWYAGIGAALMLLLNMVGPRDLLQVAKDMGPVLIFLLAMMATGHLADKAGVFRVAARLAIRAAGGNGRRLYIYIFLLGAALTTALSLDTTAVVLAPIVYSLTRELGLDPLPFVLACTYVANTASLFIPVSNLTNLIVQGLYTLPFWSFARVMFLPGLLATAANLGLFLWIFRRRIPRHYQDLAGGVPITQPRFFRAALFFLLLILVGFGLSPLAGLPLWVPALAGTAGLVIWTWFYRPRYVLGLSRGVAWSLPFFVYFLFVVIRGVENAGLSRWVSVWLGPLAPGTSLGALLALVFIITLGSNLLNNIPTILLAASALRPLLTQGALHPAALFAVLLGTNLGPNLTVVGSLANMISLGILEHKGLTISSHDYLKLGVIVTPFLVLAAAVGLWVALRSGLLP